jgi:hypothetical protein
MHYDFDLIPMTGALMRALHDGDLSLAERELSARIHPDWTLPLEVLDLRMHQLEADPTWRPWLLQAVVTRESPTLIGNVGFHGPPGHHPFEARYPASSRSVTTSFPSTGGAASAPARSLS